MMGSVINFSIKQIISKQKSWSFKIVTLMTMMASMVGCLSIQTPSKPASPPPLPPPPDGKTFMPFLKSWLFWLLLLFLWPPKTILKENQQISRLSGVQVVSFFRRAVVLSWDDVVDGVYLVWHLQPFKLF